MTEYRKLYKKDVWHWHPDCQHWNRTLDYRGVVKSSVSIIDRPHPPYSGELCNECLAKGRVSA